MADTEYKINLILEAQNKASTEIQKVSWQITGMQDALARIWISAIAISAVKKASSAIIELAWNLEQAEVAFSTMLWSEEKATQMLNELSDFAKKTPFELTGIRESAKQLLAMWIDAEDMMSTLKSLWDVSAWLSVGLDRLALNYWQVATQWHLTWLELKDFRKMGVPLVAELAKNLWKTEAEIENMVSKWQVSFEDVTNAFRTMTSEWGKFDNLMDAQSKTFQWMVSNLKDSFASMWESIGSVILPLLERLLSAISPIIQDISDWIEENPKLAWTIAVVVAGLTALLGVLASANIILPILSWAFSLLTGPIWLVIAAIAALAIAWKNNRWWIQETTQEVVSKISEIIKPWIENLKEFWMQYWDEIKIYTEAIFWAIADTIWTILTTIVSLIWFAFDSIKMIIELFKAIRNWDWEEVLNIATEYAWTLDSTLTSIFWDMWTNIKNAFQAGIDWVVEKLDWLTNKVRSIVWTLRNAWESAKEAATSAVSSAVSRVSSLLSWERAKWWPVYAWKTYLVWEKWPELFTAPSNWKIIPNNEITNNNWVTINISWVSVRNDNDIESITNEIIRRIKLEKNFGIA